MCDLVFSSLVSIPEMLAGYTASKLPRGLAAPDGDFTDEMSIRQSSHLEKAGSLTHSQGDDRSKFHVQYDGE